MNAPPQALLGQKNEKWELIAILLNKFFKKVNRKINALVRLLEQINIEYVTRASSGSSAKSIQTSSRLEWVEINKYIMNNVELGLKESLKQAPLSGCLTVLEHLSRAARV
jgi:hypothetical protein